MPFWKKAPVKQDSSDSSSTGVNGDGGKSKEKVDYKARLQHKQYLVSTEWYLKNERDKMDMIKWLFWSLFLILYLNIPI